MQDFQVPHLNKHYLCQFSLKACLHCSMEWFQNRSYSDVNRCITVPNQSAPLGSVPRKRNGPDWYGMVPLASVNSSVLLASNYTVIFSELIGISDTIPSPSTSSHHIDDCEMLEDSCGTLAVKRRIKIVAKHSSIRTFLRIIQLLSRAIRL